MFQEDGREAGGASPFKRGEGGRPFWLVFLSRLVVSCFIFLCVCLFLLLLCFFYYFFIVVVCSFIVVSCVIVLVLVLGDLLLINR